MGTRLFFWMRTRTFSILLVILFCSFFLFSCTTNGDELSFAEIDATYAVQTVIAELSQTMTTPTHAIVTFTPTSEPGFQPPPSFSPTNAPLNLATPVPSATESLCDRAAFVQHVTIPDGTSIYAGSRFVKTWRLRNVGTCSWTTAYDLVFVDGDQLATVVEVPMPGVVNPQQEVEISVPMQVPNDFGHYRGGWRLRNQNGIVFGLANNTSIFVDVQVIPPLSNRVLFSFADTFCSAAWSTSASGFNLLTCPGELDQDLGFVYLWNNPLVEISRSTNVVVLETHPTWQSHPLWNVSQNGGWIQGKYPPMTVEPGSHFRATIGCLDKATTCDVNFILHLEIEGLPPQELGLWPQVYDNVLDEVDIDLVNYTGLNVIFVLIVDANDNGGLDQAVWINPRLER